jgi:hypothetical protein
MHKVMLIENFAQRLLKESKEEPGLEKALELRYLQLRLIVGHGLCIYPIWGNLVGLIGFNVFEEGNSVVIVGRHIRNFVLCGELDAKRTWEMVHCRW